MHDPSTAAAGWTPDVFFTTAPLRAGGVWYDFTDTNYMLTDTAMTTKVTASGQAVAAVADKSGNGLHMIQATVAQRPIYTVSGTRKFLRFTVGAGWMATDAAVTHDLTMSVCRDFLTMEQGSDTTDQFNRMCSIGSSSGVDTTGNGMALYLQNSAAGAPRRYGARNTARAVDPYHGTASFPVPGPKATYDFVLNGANSMTLYVDGTLATAVAGFNPDTAHTAFAESGQTRLGLGCVINNVTINNPATFSGDLYSWLHLGRNMTGDELINMRAWSAAKIA